MSETATPATPAVPAAPEATPAPAAPAAAATPVQPQPATVTLTQEQYDQLARDASRASSAQRKADLYDKLTGGGSGHFRQPVVPAQAPSEDELKARAAEEDRKAERGLLALAADPSFREVFDNDPTLREMITKNPLAVLPIYANDALDADDAVNLVKEALEKRKKPTTPPAAPATPAPVVPPAPPAGAVNPQPAAAVNDAYEQAKKNPNTESAIAGMITAKVRKG